MTTSGADIGAQEQMDDMAVHSSSLEGAMSDITRADNHVRLSEPQSIKQYVRRPLQVSPQTLDSQLQGLRRQRLVAEQKAFRSSD